MLPKGYWLDIQNRRKYFSWLAQKLGFQVGNREHWLNIKKADVVENKVSTQKSVSLYVLTLNRVKDCFDTLELSWRL